MTVQEHEIIYRPTGNPFVDAGIFAMAALAGKRQPEELTAEDVEVSLPLLADVYATDGWARSLYSVFPNRPGITHPRSAKQKDIVLDGLRSLASNVKPGGRAGSCIACGCRDVDDTLRLFRDYIPLTGSGELLNFFPLARPGTDYCPACALAVQFSPLTYYACGKLLLLHTGSRMVMRSWAKKGVHSLNAQVASGEFAGVYNERYVNPVNALFNMVEEIIQSYEENWLEESPVIRLYHFTNYNQGPELTYYDLPSEVFRFLVLVKQHPDVQQWRQMVRLAFRITARDKDEELAHKKVRNEIYQRLINRRTVVPYFISRQTRQTHGSWGLLALYLQEVRKMGSKRIDAIKRAADEIAETIRRSDKPKRLGQLERASNYGSLRKVLRMLYKDHLALGAPAPLFTLDEYVEDLFPENGQGWRETLDLILFRIYERLHDWLQGKEELLDNSELENTIN
ncbi:MAG: type I-B CRISPR-associated protein Cas8b1/Cst1 [Firmicutes bacterium]|nr:type I-B CRISPR-associated protein Cas8b1/Cst1 [Bacillota bacterium]